MFYVLTFALLSVFFRVWVFSTDQSCLCFDIWSVSVSFRVWVLYAVYLCSTLWVFSFLPVSFRVWVLFSVCSCFMLWSLLCVLFSWWVLLGDYLLSFHDFVFCVIQFVSTNSWSLMFHADICFIFLCFLASEFVWLFMPFPPLKSVLLSVSFSMWALGVDYSCLMLWHMVCFIL